MPVDEFFTSKAKVGLRPRRRHKANKSVLGDDYEKAVKQLRTSRRNGRPVFVTGGPSLRGFKPAKKVWDDK